MKLPDYSGMFSGNNGAGAGQSKSNALEIVDVPFLSASGPGFHTYKKDKNTAIILDAPEDPEPYIWSVVGRKGAPGVVFTAFPTLARPGPSPAGRKVAEVGGEHYQARNVGGGKIATIYGATQHRYPTLVDPRVPSGPGSFKALPEATEFETDEERATLIDVFASGWAEGYRWGALEVWRDKRSLVYPRLKKYTYEEPAAGYLWHPPGSDAPPTRVLTAYNIRVEEDQTTAGYSTDRSVVSVWVGDTETNLHKVTIYDSNQQGRAQAVPIHSAAVHCLGPGKLAVVVVLSPIQKYPIPGTEAEGVWVSGDEWVPISGPGSPMTITTITTIVPYTAQFYEHDQPSRIYFSDDHGESWHGGVPLQEFFSRTDEPAMWDGPVIEYIGDGKSLAFISAVGPSGATELSCYRIEGGAAAKLPWPGDSGLAVAPCGSLGVGAYACQTANGRIVYTWDFGETWTTSKYSFVTGGALFNPFVEAPYVAAVPSSGGKKAKKEDTGSILFTVPEPDPAQLPAGTPGSEKKPRLPGLICIATTAEFKAASIRGRIPVAGVGDIYTPSFANTGYYGPPFHRSDPYPQFHGVFDKPKKKAPL